VTDQTGMIRVALVVAVARNGVIGADGGLAWRISDDLKWFKKVTMGKPVVMGRKTFQSIGRALPGRDNIIITRSADFSADGVVVARSIDAALALARKCAERSAADEISVIGGGEIYVQTLPLADRIYLTRVDVEVEGDVVFPEIDSRQWSEHPQGACEKNQRNQHDCEFFILDRRPQ
jgi:dihydrofolate reductase